MAIAIILERMGNITNGSIFATVWTAKEKEDEEAAKQIPAIIQRKKDKGFWSRMSYSLGKPRGGACFKVLVEQADGTVREYSGQDNIQGLSGPTSMRNSSNWPNWLPCVQAHSGGPLGYNTICQTSHKILEGTYVYPPDFNQATKEILQECAAIHLQIPKSLVNTMIMKEDWGNH